MNRKRILSAILLTLGMSMLPSMTVNARPNVETFITAATIESNYGATKSQNTKKTLPLVIVTSTDVIEDTVEEILTERINICKVNNEVSNTVDSISSMTNSLIAQKIENDEEIAKQKEEVQREEEEEEKRKNELEKARKDELYLLAAIIHCEARGESFTGQVAVGAVVLNRVNSEDFPDTIEEVIYQKGQFSPVASGSLDDVLISKNVNQSCIEAAYAALNGDNPIGDCLYFRTVNGKSGQIIGNHVFY